MVVKSLTKRQRRRKKLLLYIAVLFCFVLVLVGVYSSILRVRGVEVTGAKHTNVEVVKLDVENLLLKNRLLILPNNNVVFYPNNKIEEFILKTYPSVEKVEVSVSPKKIIKVEITDRFPLGVWCAETCYFYDDQGIVFKESFKYTGPIFTAWEKKPMASVSYLEKVSCEELCTNKLFSEFLSNNQIEKAIISPDMVEYVSANGYYIKAGFDATTTMDHIKKISEQKPGFLNTLEYVDVRFPTKIFYKERI